MPESTVFLLEALKMYKPAILHGNTDEMKHFYTAAPALRQTAGVGFVCPPAGV